MTEFWLVSGSGSLSREDLLALATAQQRTIEELSGLVEKLTGENQRLAARVAELERRLGRNSGNSSLPPSSDAFTRPVKPQGARSSRKRGRQPGAPGSGLALVTNPDVVRDEFPEACGGCGAGFAGLRPVDSLRYTRRQCTDIPEVSAVVTETRWHAVACACGAVTGAPVPPGVSDAPRYGPNLAAFAVYLVVHQHVPVQRAAELIADLSGAAVSEGWVAAQIPKTAGLVAHSINLIKALLVLGHVLHADESTTRIGSRREYLHVACTDRLTFLGLAPRSRAGAGGLGVLPGFRGTMVHDAYFQLYDGFPAARHQLCTAHVVRELTDQAEQHPAQVWPTQIRWALSQLIKVARACREEGLRLLPPERAATFLRALRHGVALGLAAHPRTSPHGAQSDATNLLERLRDREHEYLRFTRDLTTPPTNNAAERDLRPVKTQLKISGCHQSRAGAESWLAIRSYMYSARKHGVTPMTALKEAITNRAWLPPITLEG